MAALTSSSIHYVSGWCGTRNHAKCAGNYAGTECTCRCHAEAVLSVASEAPTSALAAELAQSSAA